MAARILFASDHPLDKRAVADALRGDGHELVLSTDGPDVMRVYDLAPPDLLIIDVALPVLNGYDIVRGIRETEGAGTHLPVMLIGEDHDVGAKVQALRAGADDYLTKPLNPEEVAARAAGLLVRFAPVQRRRARGTVHAYYGAKGGVGTTTVAVNTAIALRRKHKSTVALVDGNLHFGDHRLFLDVRVNTHSIVDVCSGHEIDDEVVRKVLVHHQSGIDLMLAPRQPHEAEHVSMESHHLLQVVEVLRGMYDYVVVDLDKRLDEHDLDIISTANKIFVVMTADLPSLKNVRLLSDTMSQLSVPADRMELVLNRATASTGINHQSAEWVLKRRIKYQIVNDYRTAATSLNNGTPFILGKSDSAIAKAVLQFADAIREKDSEPVAEAPARSTKRPDWLHRGTPFLSQNGTALVAHTSKPSIDEPARRYAESLHADESKEPAVAEPALAEPMTTSALDAALQAEAAAPDLVAATEPSSASEPEATFETAPQVHMLPATVWPMTASAPDLTDTAPELVAAMEPTIASEPEATFEADTAAPALVAAMEPTSASEPEATFEADMAAPELVAAMEPTDASESHVTSQADTAAPELVGAAEPMTTEALFDAAMAAAGWPMAAEALARAPVHELQLAATADLAAPDLSVELPVEDHVEVKAADQVLDLNDEPAAVEEVVFVGLVAADADHTPSDVAEQDRESVAATTHQTRPEVMLTDVFADYRVVAASLSNGSVPTVASLSNGSVPTVASLSNGSLPAVASPTNGSLHAATSEANGSVPAVASPTNGSLPAVASPDPSTPSPAVQFAEVIRDLAMTPSPSTPMPPPDAAPSETVDADAADREADTRSLYALIERESRFAAADSVEPVLRWIPAATRPRPADDPRRDADRSWPRQATVSELRSRQGLNEGQPSPAATRAARIFRTWVSGH